MCYGNKMRAANIQPVLKSLLLCLLRHLFYTSISLIFNSTVYVPTNPRGAIFSSHSEIPIRFHIISRWNQHYI
jgi:hypothetical protein